MNYNVDYFINKFEAIPESHFTTHLFENQDGQKCVVAHCGVFHLHTVTPEGIALKQVFDSLPITGKRIGTLIVHQHLTFPYKASCINDGLTKEYRQATPKQRVLAALHDIKAMEAIRIEEIFDHELAVGMLSINP